MRRHTLAALVLLAISLACSAKEPVSARRIPNRRVSTVASTDRPNRSRAGASSVADSKRLRSDGSVEATSTDAPYSQVTTARERRGPEIAVADPRAEGGGVYVIEETTGRRRKVSGDLSSGSDPAWSPDGSKLSFAVSNVIYVVGADGAQPRRFADGYALEWSPDGKTVAFLRDQETGLAIFRKDLATGREKRLTGATVNAGPPAWSPDGRRIAFVEGNTGTVHVIDASGSNDRALSRAMHPYLPYIEWSPDSSRLVWVAFDPVNRLTLVITDVDANSSKVIASVWWPSVPSWSPDGKLIAFSDAGYGGLSVIDPAGKHPRALRRGSMQESFEWSPDGGAIAFIESTDDSSARDLWTVDATTASARKILHTDEASYADPAWRPGAR